MKRPLALACCTALTLASCLFALPKRALAANYTMDFSVSGPVDWTGPHVDFSTTDVRAADGSWEWVHSPKTLTLHNLRFSTTDQTAMSLPAGTELVLPAGTVNSLTSTFIAPAGGPVGSVGLQCFGDLTVSGGGALTVQSGDCTQNAKSSKGVEVNGDITFSGGNASLTGIGGSAPESYGIVATGAFHIPGGTVVADGSAGTSANSGAFSGQPDLGGYINYRWRTAKTGAFTESSVAQYRFDPAHLYVEIRPSNGGGGAAVDVPRTGDNTPLALLCGLMLFSGSGLALRINAQKRRARAK